jgi:hypothetical protein
MSDDATPHGDWCRCADCYALDDAAAALNEHVPHPGPWFVLFCRVCDPDLEMPIPFTTPEARGRHAAAHRDGTGHDAWLVVDHR